MLMDGASADPDGFFFPPASLKAIATVPEPASGAAIVLAAGLGLLRRRVRRSEASYRD